ncbi:MAG: ABC transporter ATP-binding protein [Candidatus Methanomethylophilaceae archaeon]|nr:ABC transporter ATP-binding protein [Candidatus Methanomethylophilaceae archaeon]
MELKMESVSFGYGRTGPDVIHDINLELNEPGLYCIIGPNGVGKSTMIKCINRIFKPRSGRVLLNGTDVSQMRLKEVSRLIGYVPVSTNDVFSMPVMDAILLGRQNRTRWRTTPEDIDIVNRVMRMFNIQDLAMSSFNHLSAGQHQKVAICRGIVQEPEMLILDEPTANLDVQHQVYVTELLRGMAIQEGMIVLMISHDLNITAKYAHKVIVMDGGTIVETGLPEEVITEDLINRIYNVECKIEMHQGKPHIVLGSVLSI